MKIAVVGTGYVGLVSGACFADMGNDVICVDVDAKKLKASKRESFRFMSRDWRKSCRGIRKQKGFLLQRN